MWLGEDAQVHVTKVTVDQSNAESLKTSLIGGTAFLHPV
jgi:hypothetical protein